MSLDYIRNSHIIGVVNEQIYMAADTPKQLRIFTKNQNENNLELFFATNFNFEQNNLCFNQKCCSTISLAIYSINSTKTHIYAYADRFTV